MAKYETVVNADFDTFVSELNNQILNSALSMNLVDESNLVLNDSKIAVRVYDKFFYRNGNRASLSVTLVGSEGEIQVSAIGAGGGSGAIFNFSLGAESNLVYSVEEAIRKITLRY